MMIFDSHAHLIAEDHDRYKPAPLSGRLRPGDLDDPITAERLLRLMDEQGVARALVVQRAHVYGYDNSYVTDSAEKYPDRLAAVVAINAQDETAPAAIRHWVSARGAKGIRLAAAAMEAGATDWLTADNAPPVWREAARLGIPLCVHVFRSQRTVILEVLEILLAAFPDVPVVIDHFSNMATESGAPDFGFDPQLHRISARTNASIKFSTINLARLAEHDQPAAPVIARVVEAFGAGRVMWGSDIGQSRQSYPDMLNMAQRAVEAFPSSVQGTLLNEAAAAVYR